MEMLKGRAKAVEGSFFKAETDAALLQHARTLPVSPVSTPTLPTPPPSPFVSVVPALRTAAQPRFRDIRPLEMPARSLSVESVHGELRRLALSMLRRRWMSGWQWLPAPKAGHLAREELGCPERRARACR
jgi:hypothetical protein